MSKKLFALFPCQGYMAALLQKLPLPGPSVRRLCDGLG